MNSPVWIQCWKRPNYDFCISHSSVETVIRWGGLNYSHIKFLPGVACQKWSKLANVSSCYSKNKSGTFFIETRCICFRLSIFLDLLYTHCTTNYKMPFWLMIRNCLTQSRAHDASGAGMGMQRACGWVSVYIRNESVRRRRKHGGEARADTK